MPQSYLHNTAFLAIWIVVKLDQHNDETNTQAEGPEPRAAKPALTSTLCVAPCLEMTWNQRSQENTLSTKNLFLKKYYT